MSATLQFTLYILFCKVADNCFKFLFLYYREKYSDISFVSIAFLIDSFSFLL